MITATNSEPEVLLPGFAPKTTQSQLKVSVKMIGPVEAQELIDGSDLNRKVTKAAVNKYAEEMSSGRWWENGQPIILDGPKMLNGAHRSHAIVQSGVTLPFVVVEGVDARAIRTMDIGKARTLSQMLELEGKHAPQQLAEALNWLIGYEKGPRLGAAQKFTVLDRFDLLHEHPGLEAIAVNYTLRVPGKGLLNQGMYVCLDYLFRRQSPEQTVTFMQQVISGEHLQAGDPAYTYREGVTRIVTDDNLKKTAALKVKCANSLIFAWNKFRANEPWPKFKLIDPTPEIT